MKKRNLKRNNKGFTLVELIVVYSLCLIIKTVRNEVEEFTGKVNR